MAPGPSSRATKSEAAASAFTHGTGSSSSSQRHTRRGPRQRTDSTGASRPDGSVLKAIAKPGLPALRASSVPSSSIATAHAPSMRKTARERRLAAASPGISAKAMSETTSIGPLNSGMSSPASSPASSAAYPPNPSRASSPTPSAAPSPASPSACRSSAWREATSTSSPSTSTSPRSMSPQAMIPPMSI